MFPSSMPSGSGAPSASQGLASKGLSSSQMPSPVALSLLPSVFPSVSGRCVSVAPLRLASQGLCRHWFAWYHWCSHLCQVGVCHWHRRVCAIAVMGTVDGCSFLRVSPEFVTVGVPNCVRSVCVSGAPLPLALQGLCRHLCQVCRVGSSSAVPSPSPTLSIYSILTRNTTNRLFSSLFHLLESTPMFCSMCFTSWIVC
jgi:hypothetical protein